MAKRHRKVKVLVVSPPIFAAQPRPQKHPLPQKRKTPRLNYTLGISIFALIIALFEGHGFRIVNKFCFATAICGNGKIPVIVNRVRVEQLPGKIQMDQIVLNTIVINHDEREVMITRAGLYASSTTRKSNVTSLMNGAANITIPPNSTVSLEIRSVKFPRPLSCRETEVNHLHLEIRAVDGDGNIMGAGGAIGKIVRNRSGKFIATLSEQRTLKISRDEATYETETPLSAEENAQLEKTGGYCDMKYGVCRGEAIGLIDRGFAGGGTTILNTKLPN